MSTTPFVLSFCCCMGRAAFQIYYPGALLSAAVYYGGQQVP
jgi:hypothetical protein